MYLRNRIAHWVPIGCALVGVTSCLAGDWPHAHPGERVVILPLNREGLSMRELTVPPGVCRVLVGGTRALRGVGTGKPVASEDIYSRGEHLRAGTYQLPYSVEPGKLLSLVVKPLKKLPYQVVTATETRSALRVSSSRLKPGVVCFRLVNGSPRRRADFHLVPIAERPQPAVFSLNTTRGTPPEVFVVLGEGTYRMSDSGAGLYSPKFFVKR